MEFGHYNRTIIEFIAYIKQPLISKESDPDILVPQIRPFSNKTGHHPDTAFILYNVYQYTT